MSAGHIQINNIKKIFARADLNSTLLVLDEVSLDIRPGEFVSLVGTSGCGKSTLLRIIAGLETVTDGVALCDGEPINGTNPKRGLVFQEHSLFPWLTVRENIAFGLRATKQYSFKKELVDALISMVGLEEFADSFPHQLSGGMQQRVALVRALAISPDVLLLDEPLGALDSFTRMVIQEELVRLWQERHNTMILITHDVDEAIYLSQRIFIMTPRPGRIIRELTLNMSYPRNRSDSAFVDIRNIILKQLHFATDTHEDYNL
jgi:NitT/TauT family transport system ATP-binding protein